MPGGRFFPNRLPDYKTGTEVAVNVLKWKGVAEATVQEILNKMPPTMRTCDGGLYVGNCGVAYMLYYLSGKETFSNIKSTLLDRAREYIGTCLGYVQGGRSQDPPPSFILGFAGVFGVGSLIAHAAGDAKMTKDFVDKYASYAQQCTKLRYLDCECDELFVGRAGYLCGVMNLRKKLGVKVVPDEVLFKVCSAMIQSGREYARKHKSASPLMYSYYRTQYLGAAHGLASILQMLLSFPEFLKSDPSAEQDVHQAVDFMLNLEQPNGNYPPAMDEVGASRRHESEELVHWCHGAPGIVYLFARAYKVWGDSKYLAACERCAEITWQKGLLKKGPGICHGVSGSGYVFLLLFRLTSNQKYLHRAQQFAEFMLTEEFQTGARVPDAPFSLFEGRAGTVCFLADLMEPSKAEFPLFDVF